jgi:hypothetical protein
LNDTAEYFNLVLQPGLPRAKKEDLVASLLCI